MKFFKHTPRRKRGGGRKNNKTKDGVETYSNNIVANIMGNNMSCLCGTEKAKVGAIIPTKDAETNCLKCKHKTWHGHHDRRSNHSSSGDFHNHNNFPRIDENTDDNNATTTTPLTNANPNNNDSTTVRTTDTSGTTSTTTIDSSTANSSNSNSNNNKKKNSSKTPLRGKTWHGMRRSHHHHHNHDDTEVTATADSNNNNTSHHHGIHPVKAFTKISHAVAHVFQCFEEHMFPKHPLIHTHHNRNATTTTSPKVRGGVMLYGCTTPEEHYEKIRTCIETGKDLHSSEGLKTIGFEYRLVRCAEHEPLILVTNTENDNNNDDEVEGDEDDNVEAMVAFDAMRRYPIHSMDNFINHSVTTLSSYDAPLNGGEEDYAASNITSSIRSNDGSLLSSNDDTGVNTPSHGLNTCATLLSSNNLLGDFDSIAEEGRTESNNYNPTTGKLFCNLCKRRLFHIESNTMITEDNRAKFIADGDMYEIISKLVQEYAQDIMIEEGNLKWITIEDDNNDNSNNTTNESTSTTNKSKKEPIRILISAEHPIINGHDDDNRPTVFICTGRGKVRAGIFSRKHLISTGVETSTAIPIVRDAIHRNLHVVIVDPNVHGESQGFITFQKTMNYLEQYFDIKQDDNNKSYYNDEEEEEEKQDQHIQQRTLSGRDMYVLSHSASGGHMARYFLDKGDDCYFLHNIRAVAFTDSTHSVQWAKDKKKTLYDKLQGQQCVYFRCSRHGDGVAGDGNKWYLHPAGEIVQTDSFWKHRFGSIKTVWAGTNEHSLANWYSHAKIWEHFDHFLYGQNFNHGAVAAAAAAATEAAISSSQQ